MPTFGELFGVPPALTTAQVLLIDIGTDIWTAIAYSLQSAESKLMERPPRHPKKEKMVNRGVLIYSYGYIGILQMLGCWFMFFVASPHIYELYSKQISPNDYTDEEIVWNAEGMTVYYWTLVLAQIAAAIATTTKLQSVFGFCGPAYGMPNTTLNLMFVGEILLGIASVYVPFMQSAFETAALPWKSVLMPVLVVFYILIIEEVRKLIFRRREESQMAAARVASTEQS